MAFAVAITWPFALHPRSSTLGIVPSDLSASIARFQELGADMQPPFLPGRLPEIDAPDGLSTTWTLDLASLPSSFLYWIAALTFGGVASNGILGTAAYALSAASMFLFARYVTGNSGAAFVAGLAYGFWPWVYSTSTQPFGHGWVLVAAFWRGLVLAERPTARNGVWFGLASVLAMAWLQYWILVSGVLFATVGVTLLVIGWRSSRVRQYAAGVALAAVPVLVAVAIFGVLAVVASTGEIPSRSPQESYSYSARPLMYVVPHPEHPLLGDRTGEFLRSRFDGSSIARPFYADIYVGLTTLAIALVGVFWLIRRRGTRDREERRAVYAGVLACAIVVIGFLFSMPPRVSLGPFSIPMPGEAVVAVTSVFRTTHRFAAIVMLGLCLLLALGLRALLVRRSAWIRVAVVAAAAVAVPVDLWGRPDFGQTRRIDHPDVYDGLRGQPRGTVAVYPLSWIADQAYVFDRRAHGMPLFNGSRPGTESASSKLDLQALRDAGNASRLAALGVRYVVVTPGTDQPWQPQPEESFAGLRLIRRARDGTLFAVTARPRPFAWIRSGFWAPERQGETFYRWLTEEEGTIELRGACTPCLGVVEFDAASFARERTLEVRNERGRVVARRHIGTSPVRVRFVVAFNRRHELRVRAIPGPQSIHEATGLLDPRHVSVQISVPVGFRRLGGRG